MIIYIESKTIAQVDTTLGSFSLGSYIFYCFLVRTPPVKDCVVIGQDWAFSSSLCTTSGTL